MQLLACLLACLHVLAGGQVWQSEKLLHLRTY